VGYLSSNIEDTGILPENRSSKDILLIKRHETSDIENIKNNKVILLIRDYNDVLIRHRGRNFNIIKDIEDNNSFSYMKILKFYDEFVGSKIFLYYEDLLLDIEKSLEICFDFLDIKIEKDKFIDFMNKIEHHKITSIKNYHGGSRTKGDVKIKHSSILSLEQKNEFFKYLEKNHKNLSDKYLKRYHADLFLK
jgi:hypothetical protein